MASALFSRPASLLRTTGSCFLVLCAPGRWSAGKLRSEDCMNEAGRDPDKAIRYCTTAIDSGRLTNYELVHSLNNRGWAYYRKADFNRAIQDYNQAIQLQPDYAFAFNDRGLAYAGNRDFNRAIEDYSQAIKLNSDFALAFNNRGFAYASKRDNDRAIQDFNETEPRQFGNVLQPGQGIRRRCKVCTGDSGLPPSHPSEA